MIEFSIKSSNLERLSFWLEKFQLIFKSLLVIGENARERLFPLSRLQEKSIISNLIFMLHFVYLMKEKIQKNQVFHHIFVKVIKDLGLFMIFMIDHINETYGGFANITKDFKTTFTNSNSPTIPPYNFLLYEIFNNILVGVKGNKIISIPEIKTLKTEDLSDLHHVVLSDNWIYAFLDNQLLLNQISEHFLQNFYLKLSLAHQTANENRDSRKKCLILVEENNKKLKHRIENDVYELILGILETNEEKKNNDWYLLEKRRRHAKHQWKKCWKNLRIYENIWQPDDFKTQNDNHFWNEDYSFDNYKPNKYFYYEMWKYEIKNKARPYLKMNLKEPDIKAKIPEKNTQSENLLNYQQVFNLIHQNFSAKYQYSNDSPEKYDKSSQNLTENLMNLGEKAFNTLKAIVNQKSPNLNPPAEYLFQRKCYWISTLTLKTGVFTITPTKLM